MSRQKALQPVTALVEQPARPLHRHDEPIPAVCFIEDICRVLRMSSRTVARLRRHGAFPIAEIPALDKRPRWSGAEVQKFLSGVQVGRSAWRRRA